MTLGGPQAPGAQTAGRTVAIMQPYFLPYIGYYQLIAAADLFVVYDTIKYTKSGWINRNRLLRNGEPAVFTLPLRHGADHLDICERELAPTFRADTLLNQVRGAYRRAPYYEPTVHLLEEMLRTDEVNLFGFLERSLATVCRYLGIPTETRRSSEVELETGLHAQDRVIAICRATGAAVYINPPGGVELYSAFAFAAQNIALRFLAPELAEYPQFGGPFVPRLSILDVLMFNPLATVAESVQTGYRLV